MYQRRSLPVPDTFPLLVLQGNRDHGKDPVQAGAGGSVMSPQSALLPVEEGLPRLVCWGELQLLCAFLQVDFQLAPVNQALMEVPDSVGL